MGSFISRIASLLGVKGTDGTNIASPTNPLDVQERPIQTGPFSRSGAFLSTDSEWTSSTLDWFSDPAQNLGHVFYNVSATAAGAPTVDVTEEVSNDGSTWFEARTFTLNLSDQSNRRFPVDPHGYRYVRLRAGPPSSDMTDFTVASMYTPDYGRSTPRTVGENLPSDTHLDGVYGTEIFGARATDGTLRPVPVSPEGSLIVQEEGGPITPVGAKHVTGILDYISHDFGTTVGASQVARLQDLSSGGTATHDGTNGGALFSTGAAAGNTAIFLSEHDLPYSENTGHALQVDQTILLDPTSAAVTGDAYIEWGLMDGNGNGFGYGYDATGYYAFLKKGGAYLEQDYQSVWNGDRCDGGEHSRFQRAGVPEAIRIDRLNFYRSTSQFLYGGEQIHRIKNPRGQLLTAHTHEYPNDHTETSLRQADLFVGIEIHNDTTSGGDIIVRSGSWHGAIYTNKTVFSAKQPDGDFVDAKADGVAFTTATALVGNDSVASGVIDTDGWRTLEIFVETDATGTIRVDFYEDTGSPTVRETRTFSFTQDDVASGSKLIVLDAILDGVQVTYTNGGTAQTNFLFEVDFRTAPSNPKVRVGTPITTDDTAIIAQGPILAADSNGDYDEIGRDGSGSRLNTGIESVNDEFPLKPLNSVNVGQGTVTSASAVPIPSAGTGLTNRKTIEYSNHSNTVNVYWGPTSSVTATNGKILRPGADVGIEVDESVDIYWIAEDTGGTTQQSDESGATTAGTATSTSNALASDDADVSFTDGQTLEVDGFAYTKTLTDINTLRIGVEGAKAASPATETVAHVETQTGTVTSATSVASASLAGGSDLLYIVAVSRNDTNTVSSVTGGGLTFQSEVVNLATAGKHLDIWYAYGDATAGAITASMSTTTSAHISVSTFTNADSTTPIEASGTNTGTGMSVTGASLAKTALGLGYTAVSHEAASASAGAGYTERSDLTTGTGSNTNSLAAETKAFTTTGTEAATMSLASSVAWASASIRIAPAATGDITFDVEYDVNGGGYTSVGSLTYTSTTDATQYIDISGSHPLTETTINQTTVRLTRNSTSAAAGLVDHVFLEVTEGDADTAARISFAEVADTEFP